MPGAECNCHLVCPDGEDPSDCSMTQQNYSGQLGFPFGIHLNAEEGGDDVLHRTYYCATHKKYSYRQPVFVEIDWEAWRRGEVPDGVRLWDR